jgi:hypothetical protein
MALSTNIIAKIIASRTTPLDVASGSYTLADRDPINLADGVGTNQANLVWSDTRTLAASTSEELDLTALPNSPPFSNTSMVKVKAILIIAADGNTNNVEVGNAAATQFLGGFLAAAHRWAIPPGGVFLVAAPKAGWASTDGVSDKLKIANSGAGTSVDYSLILIGTDA